MHLGVFDLKVGVIILLFFMSLGSCMLPFVVSKYVKNTVVVFSVMNCLSGGVVLGAALSHMIPSATQNFIAYFANKDTPFKDYPFTTAISAVGLLLLLTIDRTLLSGAHSHSEVREHNSQKYSHSSHGSHKYKSTHSGSQRYITPQTPSNKQYDSITNITPSDNIPVYVAESPSPAQPLLAEDGTPRIDVGFNTDMLNKSISDYNAEHKSAVTKTWVFLLALSVHSVLEGLGMGAEDNEDSFFSVLFAVLAHKCLEAFALGLSIFYAKFKRIVTILMILGYSFATPLGVGVGMISASLSSNQNLIAGILVAMASGSFLYISLIEILPTELHKPRAIGLKLLAMIVGWACMVVLAFYA